MPSRFSPVLALAVAFLCGGNIAAQEPRAAAPAVPSPVVDLDKTYRLDFKLITPDDSHSYVIITSQSAYKLHYGVTKDGNQYSVDLDGTITVCDGGQRLRVTFTIALESADANGDGFDLSSRASAIVTLGKPKSVGTYGEYELKLTATVDDEAMPAASKAKDAKQPEK